MSCKEDSCCSHDKKSAISYFIDNKSQRSTEDGSCNISDSNSLSSSSLSEAESFLEKSIGIIKKGNILGHSASAQDWNNPESIVKLSEIW